MDASLPTCRSLRRKRILPCAKLQGFPPSDDDDLPPVLPFRRSDRLTISPKTSASSSSRSPMKRIITSGSSRDKLQAFPTQSEEDLLPPVLPLRRSDRSTIFSTLDLENQQSRTSFSISVSCKSLHEDVDDDDYSNGSSEWDYTDDDETVVATPYAEIQQLQDEEVLSVLSQNPAKGVQTLFFSMLSTLCMPTEPLPPPPKNKPTATAA